MSLPILPNEIFHQISSRISFKDHKECMQVCWSWYHRFRPTVLQCLSITSRRQFRQLLIELANNMSKSKPSALGYIVRCLKLDYSVGMTNQEFHLLPSCCPYLEFIDFNPSLWHGFTYTNDVAQWQFLSRFPCMESLKMTLPILRGATGRHLTHLEMGSIMVDELLSHTSMTIISVLSYTPNLISLKLCNGVTASHNLSVSEFESIHTLCPHIETLHLDSFDAHLRTTSGYLVEIETLPKATHMKDLRLNMSINSEEFLRYWAHKYPNIQCIDIQLRLLEPEYYHQAVQPENSRMKEAFALMATSFHQLKKLKAKFDEQHFPCDVFLRGLNTISAQMEEIAIHFFNFDYHRRGARNFKLLMSNSAETVKSVNISNWDRSWDYELDILEPLSECRQLNNLSLSPQPGTLTEFDVDVILDRCALLTELELCNTYNLFVRDDSTCRTVNPHQLKVLKLKHTMVNNQLFSYLALQCPLLDTLKISHVIKPYDNNIQVKIDMPQHSFKSIEIEQLQLGLRIEDSGFQCNHYSTLCSLEEVSKTQRTLERYQRKALVVPQLYNERWYHLYQPTMKAGSKERARTTSKLAPRLQRLRQDMVHKIKSLQVTRHLWEQISFVGSRIKFEDKRNWHLDIPFGYFSVRCKSVGEFKFEGIVV